MTAAGIGPQTARMVLDLRAFLEHEVAARVENENGKRPVQGTGSVWRQLWRHTDFVISTINKDNLGTLTHIQLLGANAITFISSSRLPFHSLIDGVNSTSIRSPAVGMILPLPLEFLRDQSK